MSTKWEETLKEEIARLEKERDNYRNKDTWHALNDYRYLPLLAELEKINNFHKVMQA
jgi:hypothetical protein